MINEVTEKTIGAFLHQISSDLGVVKSQVSTSEEYYKEIKAELKIVNTLNVEIYGAKDDGDGGLKTRVKILESVVKGLSDKNQQLVGINKFIGFLAMVLGIISIAVSILK
ncbi:hypothetical protein V9L05_15285 [Bernardetia sp. Wsw4-3y2]|uniref:hypothetical protein n=1 Tax=Bernardetia sp. Wsw4-3y2 TaxID=3127471 RepID=UPI0030D39D73